MKLDNDLSNTECGALILFVGYCGTISKMKVNLKQMLKIKIQTTNIPLPAYSNPLQ